LQDPQDYREALRAVVPAALRDAGIRPGQVIGIGTDFTASTVLPVLADGTPLCQLGDLRGDKHAYVKLWKHHAAQPHADRINELAWERGEPWLPRYGGKISPSGSSPRRCSCWTRRPRCTSGPSGRPAGASGLIALDWHSGNRSVLVDHHLSGVIAGLTLATTAPEIYRALVEATAFGTRVIIDAFTRAGIGVTELIMAGGLLGNELFMRVYADVMRRPLSVIGTGQGAAPGAAIHAAVAAGAHRDVPGAAAAMGRVRRDAYRPDPVSADVYDELYAEYVRLHDYFGRGGNAVMHRLRALRDRVPARHQEGSKRR
jgi:ribulose kinase